MEFPPLPWAVLQNEIWLVAVENRTARRAWGQLLFFGQTCAFVDKLSDKRRCDLRVNEGTADPRRGSAVCTGPSCEKKEKKKNIFKEIKLFSFFVFFFSLADLMLTLALTK